MFSLNLSVLLVSDVVTDCTAHHLSWYQYSISLSTPTLDICFEVRHSLMAIHTRRGASCSNTGDNSGFFLPKVVEDEPSIEKCPFWMILARKLGSIIEFLAIPGCAEFVPDVTKEFYLRAGLIIPEGCEVTNIAFYGDDGHSSLSPNLSEDSEIKEGRQAVGFIVQFAGSVSEEVQEELWKVTYDDLLFKKYDFEKNSKNEATIHHSTLSEETCAVSIALGAEMDAPSTIYPKSEFLSLRFINRHNCGIL